jgi:hypothetical protein
MLWVVEFMRQRLAIGGSIPPQKDQLQLLIMKQSLETGKDTASIPHICPSALTPHLLPY